MEYLVEWWMMSNNNSSGCPVLPPVFLRYHHRRQTHYHHPITNGLDGFRFGAGLCLLLLWPKEIFFNKKKRPPACLFPFLLAEKIPTLLDYTARQNVIYFIGPLSLLSNDGAHHRQVNYQLLHFLFYFQFFLFFSEKNCVWGRVCQPFRNGPIQLVLIGSPWPFRGQMNFHWKPYFIEHVNASFTFEKMHDSLNQG